MPTTINGCRASVLILYVALLSACGGGSGNPPASTSVSTTTLAFSVASPDEATPPAQSFTATVSAGTTYVTVLHNGAAIANASYTLSGSVLQVTVDPASPAVVGAGDFTGAVTVTGYTCADQACSAPKAGETKIVNVTYQIPAIVRFVAPYVATANAAGSVIIRGQGFKKYSVLGVTFGPTAATSFTVVSDTEIRASYPALAAGNYQVQIQTPISPGVITSQADLVAVNTPGYAATTLAYPSAAPQIKQLAYDAERHALLLAVDTAGGEILRYPYSGGTWGSAATNAIAALSDIALTTNGQQILALSQTALTEVDPTALTSGAVTPAPTFTTLGTYLKNLALGNDGNAVVTTGYAGSTGTSLYVYTTRTPAFTHPASAPSLDNSTPVAAPDGSLITIMRGDPTLTSPPSVYHYLAASALFSATSVALNQNAIVPALAVYTPPDSTTSTTRIVLSGTKAGGVAETSVYDAAYKLLGTLPSTTLAVAVKPDATRAYTFDSGASQLLSFDLTANAAGGAFPQVGAGVALAGNPGSGVRMVISPDGGTLFLAGSNQIVVQPAPP